MKKPKPKKVERLDYSECLDYIRHKLGYDPHDVCGRWVGKETPNDVPYLDFWHWLIDRGTIHNGSELFIGSEMKESAPEWVQNIIQAFVDEFGDNQVYWVEW